SEFHAACASPDGAPALAADPFAEKPRLNGIPITARTAPHSTQIVGKSFRMDDPLSNWMALRVHTLFDAPSPASLFERRKIVSEIKPVAENHFRDAGWRRRFRFSRG